MNEHKPSRSGAWTNPVVWSGLVCVGLLTLLVLRHSFLGGASGLVSVPEGQPPVLSKVPAFHLIDQDSLRFGHDQLRGQVWVANFIFTRCPTICPKLTARMAEFQRRTQELERLHLVSFSVDPEYDTPQVLARYAAKYNADTSGWSFLTGPIEAVKGAIEDGLRMSMGRDGDVTNINEILHGPHFVLVDDSSRIRGYYDVEDPAGFDNLIEDATLLVSAIAGADARQSAEN